MGLQYSPKIITTDLHTYLDVANAKSFPGEPTVNLITTNNAYEFNHSAGGTTLSWTLNKTVQPGETYILTGEFFRDLVHTGSMYFQFRLNNSSGVMIPGNSGLISGYSALAAEPLYKYFNNDIKDICVGVWKKYSLPVITIPTGYENGTIVWIQIVSFGSDANLKTYVRDLQFEQKNHSTPFVQGSRLATNGWKDLTLNGNNLDLTNARFDSNAKPIFLNDTGTAEWSFNKTLLYGTNNNFTVEIGYKKLGGNTGGYTSLIHHINGGGNRQRILLNSNNALYYEYTIAGTTYGKTSNTSTINNGTSTVFTLRKSSTTGISFFRDGLPYGGDSSVTQNTDTNQTNATYLHRSTTYQGYGEPLFYRIYTRDLSDAEILQNFNAVKGRLGL